MGVSENGGFSPQIIHFNRDFHYKSPSILGGFTPYFWGSTPRYGFRGGLDTSPLKGVWGSTPREWDVFLPDLPSWKNKPSQIRMNLHPFTHQKTWCWRILFPSCPKKIHIFLENQHVPWKSINGWKMYFLVTWSFFRALVSVWGCLSLVVIKQRRRPLEFLMK